MDQGELDKLYDEAMLTLTGSPEWDMLMEDLKKEIYQRQCDVLDTAQNWDQVCFIKGWCASLAYIINLRQRVKATLEVAEGDANADV